MTQATRVSASVDDIKDEVIEWLQAGVRACGEPPRKHVALVSGGLESCDDTLVSSLVHSVSGVDSCAGDVEGTGSIDGNREIGPGSGIVSCVDVVQGCDDLGAGASSCGDTEVWDYDIEVSLTARARINQTDE